MVAMWASNSPDMSASLQRSHEQFQSEDFVLSNISVSEIKINQARAILMVAGNIDATRKDSMNRRIEPFNRNFALVNARGEWKIWREAEGWVDLSPFLTNRDEWKLPVEGTPLGERFVGALINASSAAERKALLDENPALITIDLVRSLIRRAELSRTNIGRAMDVLELARTLAERIGDKQGTGLADMAMGGVRRLASDPRQALRFYSRALSAFESLGDRSGTASVLSAIGDLHISSREWESAVDNYQKALVIYEGLKDGENIADTCEQIGNAFVGEEKFGEAIVQYQKSLGIREKIGDKAAINATLRSIGNAYYYSENFESAIDYYRKAISGYELLGDKRSQAEVLNSIGSSAYSLGELDMALEHYQRSLAIEESLRDRRGQATSCLGIGLTHYLRGDFAPSLEYLQRNLSLLEALKDEGRLPDTLRNIALVYTKLDNYPAAISHYERALGLYEKEKAITDVAGVLFQIGTVRHIEGSYDLALDAYEKVLSYYESLNLPPALPVVLAAIGSVHRSKQNYPTALDNFQRALKWYEELQDREGTAAVLQQVGSIYYSLGDYPKTLEFAEKSVLLSREIRSHQTLWQALLTAGAAHRRLDHIVEARKAFEESIATIELMRGDLTGGERELRFFQDKTGPYLAIIELLIRSNRPVEAFKYSETLRLNMLWDLLRSGNVRITKSMTADEQDREQRLIRLLVSLKRRVARERRRSEPNPAAIAQLELQLKQTRDSYRLFKARLYRLHPELRTWRAEITPGTLADMSRLLVDNDTALIEFIVTEPSTYAFVLTKRGKRSESAASTGRRDSTVDLRTYVVNSSYTDLAERISAFRDSLATRSDRYEQLGRELFSLLLEPGRDQLNGKRNILIVPDSILWQLPFEALRSESDRFLIEDSAVAYAPSLNAIGSIGSSQNRSSPAQGSFDLLAFSKPEIADETIGRVMLLGGAKPDVGPEIENETRAMTSLYPEGRTRAYSGADVTEGKLRAEAGTAKTLLLLTPVIVSDSSPMHSALMLKGAGVAAPADGLLEAWEIAGLQLRAATVILPECRFPASRTGKNDGLIGFSWAMMVAGCPVLISNRWPGESASRIGLMTEFHRNLRTGLTAPQAMREAILKQIRVERLHPGYWANAILIGNVGGIPTARRTTRTRS